MKKRLFILLPYIACLCASFLALADENTLAKTTPSLSISLALNAQGKLFRATEKAGIVYLDLSLNLGKSFSQRIPINQKKIEAIGSLQPKVAASQEGYVYVTWVATQTIPFSSQVWFTRSIDSAQSFEKPYIIYENKSQDTLWLEDINLSPQGNITVLWKNKRGDFTSVDYARSADQGQHFTPKLNLAENCCEFCSIAMRNKPDGTVVAMWQHLFENGEHGHVIAEIPTQASEKPAIHRINFERKKVNTCSHQGVGLATGGEGKDWWGYHMAWFDGDDDHAEKSASLFYARMDGQAWVSSPAKRFGNHQRQAAHPALLSVGEQVWLAWRETETETENSLVQAMYSEDGGKNWSQIKLLASSSGAAGEPVLLARGNQGYLAWNTEKEGLMLLPILSFFTYTTP